MSTITDAGLRDVVDATLVVVYLAVSTMSVSVPIGIVLVAGDRAAAILARGQSWVSGHAAGLREWLSFVVGGALVLDGLLRLALLGGSACSSTSGEAPRRAVGWYRSRRRSGGDGWRVTRPGRVACRWRAS
jgi:hypothetical protein